jgi:hypothetical protein
MNSHSGVHMYTLMLTTDGELSLLARASPPAAAAAAAAAAAWRKRLPFWLQQPLQTDMCMHPYHWLCPGVL